MFFFLFIYSFNRLKSTSSLNFYIPNKKNSLDVANIVYIQRWLYILLCHSVSVSFSFCAFCVCVRPFSFSIIIIEQTTTFGIVFNFNQASNKLDSEIIFILFVRSFIQFMLFHYNISEKRLYCPWLPFRWSYLCRKKGTWRMPNKLSFCCWCCCLKKIPPFMQTKSEETDVF